MRQGFDDEIAAILTDTLSLHKTDGRVFPNIMARVSTSGIYIMDVTLPIEIGDRLTRALPNGLTDVFIVDDPRYVANAFEVSARFHVKVHQASPPEPAPALARGNVALSPKELVDAARLHLRVRSYEKFAAKIGISKDTLYAITNSPVKD